tara:strand:+ start:25749 stop:26255 length:507 start_codon:yes stop_codon:yes gene_type:complete
MLSHFKAGFLITLIFGVLLTGCEYKPRESYKNLNNLEASILFKENELNQGLVDALGRNIGLKKLYLNEKKKNADLYIEILDHQITRYSAGIGVGARSKEARMEYYLKLNLSLKGKEGNNTLEYKDNSYYSFDETRILALEQLEEKLKENFFLNSVKRINFSLMNLIDE